VNKKNQKNFDYTAAVLFGLVGANGNQIEEQKFLVLRVPMTERSEV
jgi:hypothetical protein